MVRQERLYCVDSRDCPAGKSCINGECIEDITPPPPKDPIGNSSESNES